MNFDRQIENIPSQEIKNDAGEMVKKDWVSPGPLPSFSIKDKNINKENAKIYDHNVNQLAGFYTTENCNVTMNTYDKNGQSVINSAGIEKIGRDVYDINDIKRGTEKEDSCDQSALRIKTDNISQPSLWEKILNWFK